MEIAVLKAISRETAELLPGTKVASLDEGGAGEIYLTLKGPGRKHLLLINPRPGMPRLHLTASVKGRSGNLGPFAQSLRNHVIGATLESVALAGLERAVSIHFTRKSEGSDKKTTLIFEAAGKKPNLILLDAEGKVLLAQSYVPLSDDTLRPILPGLAYQPPPIPDKPGPYALTEDGLKKALMDNPGQPVEKVLFNAVSGISPLIASEAAYMAGGMPDPGKILNALKSLLIKVEGGPYEPCIHDTPKGPVLSALALGQYGGMPCEKFSTMSEAAESFYNALAKRQEFRSLKGPSLKEAKAKLSAALRKKSAIESDLASSEDADRYQLFGNLLMASLNSVPEGAGSVTLTDLFSSEGATATIPLDPRLSPVKNAEGFFKKARKARSGKEILQDRLKDAESEVKGLEALLEKITKAETLEDLSALKGGQPRRSAKSRRHGHVEKAPAFPGFTSSDGYEVLYAKNARANDVLTFKVAEPMDLWLHAQGWHGAHVIVRNPERRPDIPLATILEAAEVAAYFSEAKGAGSVAVDYTFKKYVRKPKGPEPGQAIFTNNKTVFVEPKKR